MTTLLLLGAGGQLGQEIVARSRTSGFNLVAHDRAKTDITSVEMVTRAVRHTQADIVVNAAAYTAVDKAESERETAFAVNGGGPGVLADACASPDIPLIHLSTDYVFDGTKASPYREDDLPAPLGVYGASKLAGEEAVRARHKKHLILRTSWVYGKYGRNFLKTVLRRAGEGDELRVVTDQRGSPTSTADLADAILALAFRLVGGDDHWGTYHFSGAGEASWCQFAEEILECRARWAGNRAKLTPITSADYPAAALRPRNSVLDNSLIRTTFQLEAKPWQQAVRDTVDALMKPGPA